MEGASAGSSGVTTAVAIGLSSRPAPYGSSAISITIQDATLDEGWFGINIHAAGTTDWVNNWSAGCQVIHGGVRGEAWKRFDRLVYEIADQRQKRIPYTLLSSQAVGDWA